MDFDKLMSDVWNYGPTAARWRAANEAAGHTPERFLHEILGMIEQLETLEPRPPELQQPYEMRDRILAKQPIRRHQYKWQHRCSLERQQPEVRRRMVWMETGTRWSRH